MNRIEKSSGPCEASERLRQSAGRITGLDRLVHEPSRLAILTVVRALGRVQYLRLQEYVGLSKGNLSNHLAKLEEAELVVVSKHFEGKKPVTTVEFTDKGRETIETYWSWMSLIAREEVAKGGGS